MSRKPTSVSTRDASPPASDTRPVDAALHPIETGGYRIATPAIQAFSDLVNRCLRYRITGALTYGPSRIGKTRAIEYLRLLLAQTHPKVVTYHAQAEHKPRHAEGPFFANLLEAVGYPEPDSGSNPAKRIRLVNKIKEACTRNGSGTVVLFCDEAQRYDENEYEWLRDVHDHLDRIQIRLFTFLVGQQELLAVKTALQRAKKTQIVARLMVEELAFFGIRNVSDVATCLDGYDQTCFPRDSDWSFTRFYVPQAVASGDRLADDAPLCGPRSSSCTTSTACPANSRSRWSPSRGRWRSCSRTASRATQRATAPTPHCGMWPHAAAAISSRARHSARN